jgi:hypothetical protein
LEGWRCGEKLSCQSKGGDGGAELVGVFEEVMGVRIILLFLRVEKEKGERCGRRIFVRWRRLRTGKRVKIWWSVGRSG